MNSYNCGIVFSSRSLKNGEIFEVLSMCVVCVCVCVKARMRLKIDLRTFISKKIDKGSNLRVSIHIIYHFKRQCKAYAAVESSMVLV